MRGYYSEYFLLAYRLFDPYLRIEVLVTRTDESSRFAVLTKDQYLASGRAHTYKDRKSSWKEINYVQGQVISHCWWICKILGYCKKTDHDRFMRNIQKHSLEVPEMCLLVKDHKLWSESTGKQVPSRPVLSGNKGVNTHLSELISEILEPIVTQMKSGEVVSTEEALFRFVELNKEIRKGRDLSDINVLESLGEQNKSQIFQDEWCRLLKTFETLEYSDYLNLSGLYATEHNDSQIIYNSAHTVENLQMDDGCGDDISHMNTLSQEDWDIINKPITNDAQTIRLLEILISGNEQQQEMGECSENLNTQNLESEETTTRTHTKHLEVVKKNGGSFMCNRPKKIRLDVDYENIIDTMNRQ